MRCLEYSFAMQLPRRHFEIPMEEKVAGCSRRRLGLTGLSSRLAQHP
jgi:hypothetical protein